MDQPLPEKETPAPKPISVQDMEQYIRGLGPDSELFAGRKYFELLYRKKGLKGVLDFVERGIKALDEQAELDPFYNFTPHERELFRKTPIKWMSRRGVALGLSAYFVAVEGTLGAEEMGKSIYQLASGKDLPEPGRKERLTRLALYSSGGVAIAGAVGIESKELLGLTKLSQIGDAIHELHDQFPAENKVKPNAELEAKVTQLAELVEALRAKIEERTQGAAEERGTTR